MVKSQGIALLKEAAIKGRKEELNPLLGKYVVVKDGDRLTIAGKLRYDNETQKYFISILDAPSGEHALLTFYPLEVEGPIVGNLITLVIL